MNSPATIAHYTDRSMDTIATLDPALQPVATAHFNWLLDNDILALIYSGYRPYDEQAALYAAYLEGGPRAAPPGQSWHQYGLAYDLVPIENGQANWSSANWAIIDEGARQLGLTPGSSFDDTGHYEYSRGMSIFDYMATMPTYTLPEFTVTGRPVTPWVVMGGLGLLAAIAYKYG